MQIELNEEQVDGVLDLIDNMLSGVGEWDADAAEFDLPFWKQLVSTFNSDRAQKMVTEIDVMIDEIG